MTFRPNPVLDQSSAVGWLLAAGWSDSLTIEVVNNKVLEVAIMDQSGRKYTSAIVPDTVTQNHVVSMRQIEKFTNFIITHNKQKNS